jgi:hypothetical protein
VRWFASSVLWTSAGLLVGTQAGYPAFLAALRRARDHDPPAGSPVDLPSLPAVSLIIAAYREEAVIADKVRNALALEWPRDRLQVIVAVDGGGELGADMTAARAREAGADLVLELPRAGKVRSQDAAVRAARGDLLAFSDANAMWATDALAELVAPFADPAVGFACGSVAFVNESGTNQEGVYWRYELWLRAQESALVSVTAGNGAIYAVRPAAYFEGDPRVSHDLAFPFALVKRGWRAVYAPRARATEKMVPSIEGEWARKRRMMAHAWPGIVEGGLLDPRGYPPLYAVMIASHRLLRYATPLLHVAALAAAPAAARRSRAARVAGAAQVALLAGAAAGGRVRARPLLIARYYVLTTASIAAGLHDWLRHGTPAGWDAAEGTR